MLNRFWTTVLTLCMALTLLSVPAFAEEPAGEPELPSMEADWDGPSSEELFELYIGERLGFVTDSGISTAQEGFGGSEYSNLSADEKELYNLLRPLLLEIAAGERTNTRFELGRVYPAASSWDSASKVYSALENDYPASLYWCGGYAIYPDEPQYAGYTGTLFGFVVRESYRPAGGGNYDFDPSTLAGINATLRNVESIVARHEAKSDYEKLYAYLDTICRLVVYDYESYHAYYDESGNFLGDSDTDTSFGDLLNVFDGDPSTNVVCQGYSRAFQYLCDRTNWKGDIECYTVNGRVGSTPSQTGRHAWNIVRIDGASYLVDVTHCDYTYDWIASAKPDWNTYYEYNDRCFLVGGEMQGSDTCALNIKKWVIPNSGGMYLGESQKYYIYSDEIRAELPASILNLAPQNYEDTFAHGTVTPSLEYAIEGEAVTLTLSPHALFRSGEVQVTRADGVNVTVSKKGANVYTFPMPASDVTVHAEFEKVEDAFLK